MNRNFDSFNITANDFRDALELLHRKLKVEHPEWVTVRSTLRSVETDLKMDADQLVTYVFDCHRMK